MKPNKKSLSISIDPNINELLEDGGYNKSKLINKLIDRFITARKLIPEKFKK